VNCAHHNSQEFKTSITLEIYGVDEGSRTPGLQDHNLAL
jgi:hypothetical protein